MCSLAKKKPDEVMAIRTRRSSAPADVANAVHVGFVVTLVVVFVDIVDNAIVDIVAAAAVVMVDFPQILLFLFLLPVLYYCYCWCCCCSCLCVICLMLFLLLLLSLCYSFHPF
jgi:hypothetical protein